MNPTNPCFPTAPTAATAPCNTSALVASRCSALIGPAPLLVIAKSRTRPTSTVQRADHGNVPTRIAAAGRALARWLSMSVSATPSAQAISTLSPRDRIGERH